MNALQRSTVPPSRLRSLSTQLDAARDRVREELGNAGAALAAEGLPVPTLDGKLLRPTATYIVIPPERRSELDQRFWMGLLAVEMAHEASLLHDDILDGAEERRGRPTMAASSGIGPALVRGDHLLTASYRAAAKAEASSFLDTFIRSVERTVAGEIAQGQSQGTRLGEAQYLRIIRGKSGELFRASFFLPSSILGLGDPDTMGEIGADLGCLYQMVDDFLDYCPATDRGKPPLQDYRQKKWTWPLGLIGVDDFSTPEEEILRRLFRPLTGSVSTPSQAAVSLVEAQIEDLMDRLAQEGMVTRLVRELLEGWSIVLGSAADREVVRSTAPSSPSGDPPPHRGEPLGDRTRQDLARRASAISSPEARIEFFGRHAKSFRFASRFFPPKALRSVAGVYAFCRITDDLVDRAVDPEPSRVRNRLDVWAEMAREAYQGRATGVALLDDVMGEMRTSAIPFHYVEELLRGVEMDVTPSPFQSAKELRIYAYRVASVVGGWLTELFGVRDPWVLDRAFALGQAMQLTNILRDVGEDLLGGRLYLPLDRMDHHGLDRSDLEAMAALGQPISSAYEDLLEELMRMAEADYERAFEALPSLPWAFRLPVAVAGTVYRGIHAEIRKNGYDNFRRRAHTSLIRKSVLGFSALVALFRDSRRNSGRGDVLPSPRRQPLEDALI